MRTVLLLLSVVFAISACSKSNAAPPGKAAELAAPAPNFVCARFAKVKPAAKCTPEMTDVGTQHTHSATVTVGEATISCVINDTTLSAICGEPIVVQQPAAAQPPAQPATPSSKK